MNTALLLIQFCASFLLPAPHLAWQQYRCDGRVQYRPCEPAPVKLKADAPPPSRAKVKPFPAAIVQGRPYARIVRQEFIGLPGSEGVWHGLLEGNGEVRLHMEFIQDGVLKSSRFMGRILLFNKTTTFKFRSSTPPGKAWSWRIRASAV